MTPRKTVVGGEGVASAFNGGQLLHLGNPSSTAPPPHDASSSSISSGVASTGGAGGCTSPMTIFYNGSVSVFQVPADKVCFLSFFGSIRRFSIDRCVRVVHAGNDIDDDGGDGACKSRGDGDRVSADGDDSSIFFDHHHHHRVWDPTFP